MGRYRVGQPVARNRAIWITDPAYGAKGDGATDNTTAINNAIAAGISANVPVFIPPGTFNHSGTITNGTNGSTAATIYGAGGSSVLSATTPTTQALIILGNNAALFNFKKQILSPGARNQSPNNACYAITEYFTTNVTIANVHVVNSAAAGIFHLGGTNDVTMNCLVETTDADGIMHNEPASNFTVKNNYVFQAGDDGISTASYSSDPGVFVNGGTITGNSVIGHIASRNLGINGGQTITVSGNHFERGTGCGFQGSSAFPTYPPGPAFSFTGNTVKSTFDQSPGTHTGVNGGGLNIYNDNSTTMGGCTITGNQLISCGGNYILVNGNTTIDGTNSVSSNDAYGVGSTLYTNENTSAGSIVHTGNTYHGTALPAVDLVPVTGGLNPNLSLSFPQGIVAWNSGMPLLTGHSDVDQAATGPTTFASIAGATGVTATALTVGSNASSMLVFIMFTNNTPTSPIIVWDSGGTNQTMTNINSGQMATGQAYVFGLVNPTPGNKTIKATWTGTGSGQLFAISFVGTPRDTVANAFPNSSGTTPTGTTNTLTISGGSSAGVCICAVYNNTRAYSSDLSTTLSGNNVTAIVHNSTTDGWGEIAYATGSASTVWSSSLASSTEVAYIGCNVAALSV